MSRLPSLAQSLALNQAWPCAERAEIPLFCDSALAVLTTRPTPSRFHPELSLPGKTFCFFFKSQLRFPFSEDNFHDLGTDLGPGYCIVHACSHWRAVHSFLFFSLVLNKAFKMSLARSCLCTLSFYTTNNNLRYVNKLEPDLGNRFLVIARSKPEPGRKLILPRPVNTDDSSLLVPEGLPLLVLDQAVRTSNSLRCLIPPNS